MRRVNSEYSPLILRIAVSLLFIFVGLPKLLNANGTIIADLQQLGFPASIFFGWLVLIVGAICTVALFFGWKVKYVVWPLIVILFVALVLIYIPGYAFTPESGMGLFFHVLAITTLISIYLTGPGFWAVDK